MGGKGRTGHAVISHAPGDTVAADKLQRKLEAAGIPVWRDISVLPGEDWRTKIRQAITDDALAFVACFSGKSLSGGPSRHNEELALAIEQMRARPPGEPWLIPVRFDSCRIPDWDIGGGRTLGSIRAADLFGERADSDTERLITSIARILGHAGQQPGSAETSAGDVEEAAYGQVGATGEPQAGPSASTGRRVRSWDVAIRAAWVGGACVIVAAFIGLIPYFFGGGKAVPRSGEQSKSNGAVSPTIGTGAVLASSPVSFAVGVAPPAVANPSTRSEALRRIINEVDQKLAARRMRGRAAGYLMVFAPGPESEVGQAITTAHLVLHALISHDETFAQAIGTGFWVGDDNDFLFRIFFFRAAKPQQRATPTIEHGTVTSVQVLPSGLGWQFLFHPNSEKPYELGLGSTTPWRDQRGRWHTDGRPACFAAKLNQRRQVTVAVVNVRSNSAGSVVTVVYIECGG